MNQRISTISHRERMETVLSGGQPDRVPLALWRHFPVDDQTPDGLAAVTVLFQKTYDFDLVKVSPPSSYCLKDWGIEDRWEGSSEGTRVYTKAVIRHLEDWKKLPLLDPRRGWLGAQLECLRRLLKEFHPATPVIQTIFSPMAQAKNLVGRDNLVRHLRRDPTAVQEGLETITQTTINHLEMVIKTGVDGIFFAVQFAQFGLLSGEEFETFCRPYDLRVLEAARNCWIRMVHLHGEDVMFDQVAGYPVNIINWHDQNTPPSLAEARLRNSTVLCGGLSVEDIVLGSPESVRQKSRQAIETMEGRRLILGTGCVMPIITPHANITAVRSSVESFRLPLEQEKLP